MQAYMHYVIIKDRVESSKPSMPTGLANSSYLVELCVLCAQRPALDRVWRHIPVADDTLMASTNTCRNNNQ